MPGHRTEGGEAAAAVSRYVADVFGVYRAALHDRDLRGARILDIGTGGRYEIGHAFLDAGASEVVCVDAYVAQASDDPRIRVVEADIADGAPGLEPESFDVAVSWVALQEMRDLGRALEMIDRLLTPGGRMVHTVDLEGYSAALARLAPRSPLAHLAVPGLVYRAGRSPRRPNRLRVGAYRELLEGLGYDVRVDVNGVLGRDVRGERADPPWTAEDVRRVTRARRFLRPAFRRLPDEDLLVTNATIVATKPGR